MLKVHKNIRKAIEERKNYTVWKYDNGNKKPKYRVICDHAGIRVYHFNTLMYEKLGFERLLWFYPSASSKALTNALLDGTPFRLHHQNGDLCILNSKTNKTAKVETCDVTPYNLESLEELTK